MKRCSTCKLDKEENEFGNDSTKKDGLRSLCKSCSKEYFKNYHLNHYKYAEPKPLGKWSKENPEQRKETRLKHYENNKEQINVKKKEWRTNNHEKNAAQQFKDGLKRKYGLTLEQFNQMVYNQDNKCEICHHEMTPGRAGRYAINIDHDHETGEVRRLLCNCCNKVIGYAYEDEGVLESAINYLKKYKRHLKLHKA